MSTGAPLGEPHCTHQLRLHLPTLSIPVALTYIFGKMVGSIRHGVAILIAMVMIFGAWVGFAGFAEHQSNPAVAAAGGQMHSADG